MKKRAVAILMSLALAIGNMIPMPVYAAQEATEESTEEITVEEEAGGTEEKDESEEAEGAELRWSVRPVQQRNLRRLGKTAEGRPQ